MMPNGIRQKEKTKSILMKRGNKRGKCKENGMDTYLHTAPGQGYYNLPNLQKFHPRNFVRGCGKALRGMLDTPGRQKKKNGI